MRLTLRTMLAYLDDILEPADAQELGKKIEESEFASSLVHRVRNSMRRLRLGAPKLDARGMGLDTNTVAEYLDNALPADRVPDFEKVCLESNMHLAEVASCHQILTIVLGEPADVEPALRERIYRVGSVVSDSARRVDKEHQVREALSPPQGELAAGQADEPAKKRRRQPEVPDYLRASRQRRRWPWLVAGLALIVLALLGLPAIGIQPWSFWTSKQVSQTPSTAPAETAEPGPLQEPSTAINEGAAATALAPPTETPADKTPAVTPSSETPLVADDQNAAAAGKTSTGQEADPKEPAPGKTQDAATPPSDNGLGKELAEAIPPAAPEPAPEPAPEQDAAEQDAAESVDVGRNTSAEEQVLIRWNPEMGVWHRVAPRAVLTSTDRLVALPTYRPQITLARGVQIVLAGESTVSPLLFDEQGVPGLAIERGRTLVFTDGVSDHVHVVAGLRRGEIRFSDAGSVAAVEVRSYLPPGEDPRTSPPKSVTLIYAASGVIRWHGADKEPPIEVKAAQVCAYVTGEGARILDSIDLPPWVEGRDLKSIEERASRELEPLLQRERSIILTLKERAEDRRAEVRSLSARCLAYLGQAGPLVKEFTDERQYSYWRMDYEALRMALLRDQAAAEDLMRQMERANGEDAQLLYELLLGYSEQQFTQETASRLIDLLDSENLAVRVLAFENLRRITGLGLLYNPQALPAGRRPRIIKWRERLDEMSYQAPTSPFPQPSASVPPASRNEADEDPL